MEISLFAHRRSGRSFLCLEREREKDKMRLEMDENQGLWELIEVIVCLRKQIKAMRRTRKQIDIRPERVAFAKKRQKSKPWGVSIERRQRKQKCRMIQFRGTIS